MKINQLISLSLLALIALNSCGPQAPGDAYVPTKATMKEPGEAGAGVAVNADDSKGKGKFTILTNDHHSTHSNLIILMPPYSPSSAPLLIRVCFLTRVADRPKDQGPQGQVH